MTIKDAILEQIRIGRAKMRPRWHFVLKTALLITGAGILALAILYLASLTLFISRQTGMGSALVFGLRGVGIFLLSLPWLIILLAAVFLVLLEILVKHHSFAYRRPLLYSLFGIIILVLAGGLIIANTGFHRGLSDYARQKRIPFIDPLYRGFGREPRHIHTGVITEITTDGFLVRNRDNEILTVIITPETRFSREADFAAGGQVVILGQRENNTVRAFGVRWIEEMRPLPFRR